MRRIYFSVCAEHSSVNDALMPQPRQEMGLGRGWGWGRVLSILYDVCVE